MPEIIQLVPAGDGLYTEPGTDVTWVRDRYTDPRECVIDCTACGKPITEDELWTCLDGGEGAHKECVVVRAL